MEAWQKVCRGGGRKILIIVNENNIFKKNGDFKKITIHIVTHHQQPIFDTPDYLTQTRKIIIIKCI